MTMTAEVPSLTCAFAIRSAFMWRLISVPPRPLTRNSMKCPAPSTRKCGVTVLKPGGMRIQLPVVRRHVRTALGEWLAAICALPEIETIPASA
jgi:hypothetical protein